MGLKVWGGGTNISLPPPPLKNGGGAHAPLPPPVPTPVQIQDVVYASAEQPITTRDSHVMCTEACQDAELADMARQTVPYEANWLETSQQQQG